MRGWIGCLLLTAMGFAVWPAVNAEQPKPLPTDRSQILKGGTWNVEGRRRIPAGVEITVQKNTKITGNGEAFLEIEGKLTVQGISGAPVVFDGVTIELQRKFAEVTLVFAEFRGTSHGIYSKKDGVSEGKLRTQDTQFESPSTLQLVLTGSSQVDLRRTVYYTDLSIKAVAADGATGSNVKLLLKECQAGRPTWPSGLRVEGLAAVEVRESQLGGEVSTFIDCAAVAIDSCYVFSRTLEFIQSESGRFGRTQVQNCDVQSSKVCLNSPAMAASVEKAKFENCWFGGETSVRAIREKVMFDRDDDVQRGVQASVDRVSAKPLQLCWQIIR